MNDASRPLTVEVRNAHVRYRGGAHAVRNVDLSIAPGETVAVVGESGCGKTTLANAIVGLLPTGATVTGAIVLGADRRHGDSVDLVTSSERTRRSIRGKRIGYVPQNPFTSFDPLRTVGHHVDSAWRVHGERADRETVIGIMSGLDIGDAARRLGQRPHTWSGGMLQRASIAGGSALEPQLIVADEPTSALDAELARSTLLALRSRGSAILLITHDIVLASEVADRMYILYAGEVVETGAADELPRRPRHPYSRALVAAIPREIGVLPAGLDGSPPGPHHRLVGCAFASRCSARTERCVTERPRFDGSVACHEPAVYS